MVVREVQCDFDLRHESGPRSEGTHVSELIADAARRTGVLLTKEDEGELDWTLARYRLEHGDDIVSMFPTAIYRVATGLAWERWYGPQHPEIGFHGIGELVRDGIIGSPDGVQFVGRDGIVHEIKLTWKSSRSDREEPRQRIAVEWMWLAQIKSYLAMLSGLCGYPCTQGVLHVFWVCGNYKGSGPQAKRYAIDFTHEEIEANWKVMKAVDRWRKQEACSNG
jgi:hypothetical protein